MEITGMIILAIITILSLREVAEDLLENEPFEAFLPTTFAFLTCWGISVLWESVFA